MKLWRMDNNSWKWICRLFLEGSKKYLVVSNEDKSENKILINEIDDIYKHDRELLEVLQRHIDD